MRLEIHRLSFKLVGLCFVPFFCLFVGLGPGFSVSEEARTSEKWFAIQFVRYIGLLASKNNGNGGFVR